MSGGPRPAVPLQEAAVVLARPFLTLQKERCQRARSWGGVYRAVRGGVDACDMV